MKISPGTKFCLHCEYQLTGLVSSACPECGRSFTHYHKDTYYTMSYGWEPRLKTVWKLGFYPLGIFIMLFQCWLWLRWDVLEPIGWLAVACVVFCTILGFFLTLRYAWKSRQPRGMKFRRSLLMFLLLAANYPVLWCVAYIVDTID